MVTMITRNTAMDKPAIAPIIKPPNCDFDSVVTLSLKLTVYEVK